MQTQERKKNEENEEREKEISNMTATHTQTHFYWRCFIHSIILLRWFQYRSDTKKKRNYYARHAHKLTVHRDAFCLQNRVLPDRDERSLNECNTCYMYARVLCVYTSIFPIRCHFSCDAHLGVSIEEKSNNKKEKLVCYKHLMHREVLSVVMRYLHAITISDIRSDV